MNLKYLNIIYLDLFIVTGYLLGLFLHKIVPFWIIVLIIGEILGLLYLSTNKLIEFEKPVIGTRFKKISIEYLYVVLSSSISTGLNYLDRFLIPLLINLQALSIYYAAQIIPKILMLIINPLLNVVLSYMTNSDDLSVNKLNIFKLNGILFVFMIPLYFTINFITPFAVNILYPNLSVLTLPIVPLASAIVIFQILANVNTTILLTNLNMSVQVIVQNIFLIIYLTISIVLSYIYGLEGFMKSALLSYIIKCVMLIYYIYKNPRIN